MIAFVPPDAPGVISQLRDLADPRIWIIGGSGPTIGSKAHYFDTFVNKFMPESPGDKVDAAVLKVLTSIVEKSIDAKARGW